jgi:hypothetical protein
MNAVISKVVMSENDTDQAGGQPLSNGEESALPGLDFILWERLFWGAGMV